MYIGYKSIENVLLPRHALNSMVRSKRIIFYRKCFSIKIKFNYTQLLTTVIIGISNNTLAIVVTHIIKQPHY